MGMDLLKTDCGRKNVSPYIMLENVRRMLNHRVRLSEAERQEAIQKLLERIKNPDKTQIPDDLTWWAGYFDEMELSKDKSTYRFVSVP